MHRWLQAGRPTTFSESCNFISIGVCGFDWIHLQHLFLLDRNACLIFSLAIKFQLIARHLFDAADKVARITLLKLTAPIFEHHLISLTKLVNNMIENNLETLVSCLIGAVKLTAIIANFGESLQPRCSRCKMRPPIGLSDWEVRIKDLARLRWSFGAQINGGSLASESGCGPATVRLAESSS